MKPPPAIDANADGTRAFLEQMPAFRHLGCRVTATSSSGFEIELTVAELVTFAPARVPAAIIGALADFAGGAACSAALDAGSFVSTMSFGLNLVAPAIGQLLTARGRLVAVATSIAFGAAEVFAHDGNRVTLCATAQVTMRISRPRGA